MAASTVTPLAKYKLVFLGDQVGAVLLSLCLCRSSCEKKGQWAPWFCSCAAQLLQEQRTNPLFARQLPYNLLLPAGTACLCSRWARPASSRGSCTTNSTQPTRCAALASALAVSWRVCSVLSAACRQLLPLAVAGSRAPHMADCTVIHAMQPARAAARTPSCCRALPPQRHFPTQPPGCRPPSALTFCRRRCTWKIGLCGCSCGALGCGQAACAHLLLRAGW